MNADRPQSEEPKIEKEAMPEALKSFEVIVSPEINIESYATGVRENISSEASRIGPDARQTINSSIESVGASQELVNQVSNETGINARLEDFERQAKELAKGANAEIERVTSESGGVKFSEKEQEDKLKQLNDFRDKYLIAQRIRGELTKAEDNKDYVLKVKAEEGHGALKGEAAKKAMEARLNYLDLNLTNWAEEFSPNFLSDIHKNFQEKARQEGKSDLDDKLRAEYQDAVREKMKEIFSEKKKELEAGSRKEVVTPKERKRRRELGEKQKLEENRPEEPEGSTPEQAAENSPAAKNKAEQNENPPQWQPLLETRSAVYDESFARITAESEDAFKSARENFDRIAEKIRGEGWDEESAKKRMRRAEEDYFGEVNLIRARKTQQVNELSPQTAPTESGPDNRLNKIKFELLRDWEKKMGRDMFSPEGQIYQFGPQDRLLHPGELSRLDEDARRELARRFPDEAEKQAEQPPVEARPEIPPVPVKRKIEVIQKEVAPESTAEKSASPEQEKFQELMQRAVQEGCVASYFSFNGENIPNQRESYRNAGLGTVTDPRINGRESFMRSLIDGGSVYSDTTYDGNMSPFEMKAGEKIQEVISMSPVEFNDHNLTLGDLTGREEDKGKPVLSIFYGVKSTEKRPTIEYSGRSGTPFTAKMFLPAELARNLYEKIQQSPERIRQLLEAFNQTIINDPNVNKGHEPMNFMHTFNPGQRRPNSHDDFGLPMSEANVVILPLEHKEQAYTREDGKTMIKPEYIKKVEYNK